MRLARTLALALMGSGCGGGSSDLLGGADASQDSPSSPLGETVDCTGDAGPNGVDPSIETHAIGTNGTFDDACDPQGNLVEYVCETTTLCGPGPNPSCTTLRTGRVVPKNVDCAGHCRDGWCDDRCPATGQLVTYVSIDGQGNPQLHNHSDGRSYACTLVFDNPNDAVDCKTTPTASTQATVVSLGLSGAPCTGGGFGNIGLTVPPDAKGVESCAYACSITY
jgi:hypothetical protein